MALIQIPDENNNFIGTDDDDLFNTTSDGPSTYFGLGGDDVFIVPLGGDTVDGGDGFDEIDLPQISNTSQTIIRADRGFVISGVPGEGKTFVVNVESFRTSSTGAIPVLMIGDDADNRLETNNLGSFARGGAGNDQISLARGGTAFGDDGNDSIRDGNLGTTPTYFDGGAGDDTLTIFSPSDDNILLGREGNDTLTSDEGADRLFGGADDDTLFGNG
ncbi:MAG: hypothetical protein RIM80_13515, partial [Alphaproteobacteria bacterium]